MQLLKGKKVLVTGGTAGIGKQIALTCVEQGADVIIFGTNPERSSQVLEELKEKRSCSMQKSNAYLVDISSSQEIEKAVEKIWQEWGTIDVLVNNAGITQDTLLMKMTEEQWDKVLDTNLKSLYLMCKAFIRPMLKARQGKIINISSVVGLTGNAGQVNYAASKAGMIGFTKSLALEVASRGICVNCVAPGFIKTSMTDGLTEEQKKGILQKIPMQQMGSPEQIAHAVLFLASSLSDYMTGQVLVVDGGMVMNG